MDANGRVCLVSSQNVGVYNSGEGHLFATVNASGVTQQTGTTDISWAGAGDIYPWRVCRVTDTVAVGWASSNYLVRCVVKDNGGTSAPSVTGSNYGYAGSNMNTRYYVFQFFAIDSTHAGAIAGTYHIAQYQPPGGNVAIDVIGTSSSYSERTSTVIFTNPNGATASHTIAANYAGAGSSTALSDTIIIPLDSDPTKFWAYNEALFQAKLIQYNSGTENFTVLSTANNVAYVGLVTGVDRYFNYGKYPTWRKLGTNTWLIPMRVDLDKNGNLARVTGNATAVTVTRLVKLDLNATDATSTLTTYADKVFFADAYQSMFFPQADNAHAYAKTLIHQAVVNTASPYTESVTALKDIGDVTTTYSVDLGTDTNLIAPDLVIAKTRSAASVNGDSLGQGWIWADSTRGSGSLLQSNTTAAEVLDATELSFTSTGFKPYLGRSSIAAPGTSYVSYLWKKGTTPGFDVVAYSGTGAARTIAHSLNATPSFIIIKSRSASTTPNWVIGHAAKGWGGQQYFDTGSWGSNTGSFNNTAPTTSVFSVGTDNTVNQNGVTYIAYLWAEIAGFSKFGAYTGNGATDGPFVYCGFKPRYLLIKRTDTAGYDWMIYDSVRDTTTPVVDYLRANLNNTETSSSPSNDIDFTSNGFKLRGTGAGVNASTSATHIFAAFAESPFKYATAR